MSRKTVKMIAIIIIVAMVMTSFSFVLFLPNAFGGVTPEEQRYINEQLKEFEHYLKYIHENYKDEVDYKTLINGAFEGAMNALGDPYSVYFVDARMGQAFMDDTMGEYEGIGAHLSLDGQNNCVVTSAVPKGPADKAGILPGDIIVKIGGRDVRGKPLLDITEMLKGKAGTTVIVVVDRLGKEHTFTIIREKIVILNIEYKMLEGDIGYILLKGFDINGPTEFRKAKNELIKSGAESLIIDVRDNPGGLINTAVEIASEFIANGDITHLKQKGEIFETIRSTSRSATQIPVVLLINEDSASASEILAGALKDNKAATLVGMTTYGKGSAQYMSYTESRQPYKLSIYYFLTPDKHDIHGAGITPDYIVRNALGGFREEALNLYGMFAPFVEDTKPKAGDKGLNVFAAQQRLYLLGYKLDITAAMDAVTVEAIKKFQGEQGLYAYGQLDFTTMRKIEETVLSYIRNDSNEDLQLLKAIEVLKQ